MTDHAVKCQKEFGIIAQNQEQAPRRQKQHYFRRSMSGSFSLKN